MLEMLNLNYESCLLHTRISFEYMHTIDETAAHFPTLLKFQALTKENKSMEIFFRRRGRKSHASI